MTTLHEQLSAHGIRYKSLREGQGTQRLACPRCPEEKERRKPSLALTILADGGAVWLCHRCGFAGGAVNGTNHDWLKQYRRTERAGERNAMRDAAPPQVRQQMDDADAVQVAAIGRIRAQWLAASPADPAHPYLLRKGIAPTNWRQLDGKLLVPLRREGWGMVDIQYIDSDGGKRYAKGISTRGIFYIAKWRTDGRINLCEGAATAVAIAAHTGDATVAAMSRTNLLPVAQMLKRRHPERELLVLGDNDHRTPGNPGKTDAIAAALAVHAAVTWPEFPPGSEGTDFLDLWQQEQRGAA